MSSHAPVRRKLLVVTDLDGSLLDERTYSFEEAKPALALLTQERIPLVLCSSKTRAELEIIRKHLRNEHPFISENGGGIFIPEDYFPFPVEGENRNGYRVISLGLPYREVRRHFIALRERLSIPVRGFGDMDTGEIMDLTGLPEHEASRARTRDYDEPFVFEGRTDERFLQEIEADGLRWTQGRIFHIMGTHDKGKAVEILRKRYERAYGPVATLGLGDSLNDLQLLLAVDKPVLIRRTDGTHDPRINLSGLYRTDRIGPAGWNEAVLKLLKVN